MVITLKDQLFTREDPILVLEFLPLFVREENIQGILDAQSFITLPPCSLYSANSLYEAGVQMISPKEGGFYSSPDAVRYLLCNYSKFTHISAAITDIRAVSETHYESEKYLAKNIHYKVTGFGSVWVLTLAMKC